ncbi:hypothetical protein [Bacillus sp. ISL-7]|uniref:hypothetical protein n=1 Tax=Bacillus sp. ISL-7 TaxID=2819136 RepID=UPI001BEA937B|nr:hypothetical protein [Bacillus sp. ISL-7]MBT2733358.1 hypothetical protein [Bacillus sp. ISL-7]
MKQGDIVKRLSEVPIFKELSTEEIEPIVKIAQTRFYKHKMFIFMQDDQSCEKERLCCLE